MLKSNPLRLVVDTNLWISFLISDREKRLDTLLFSEKVKLLFSVELLAEINKTITKPKLQKYFPANAFEDMLLNLEAFILFVDVEGSVNICRDPKDNFLLSLASEGEADFLITGDKDLLDLHKFGKTQIVSFSKFLEIRKLHRDK